MKSLRIINGDPEYLGCTMYGSYYIPCEIIKRNKKSVRIEYENELGENEQVTIPNSEVEEVHRYWKRGDKTDIKDFLLAVRKFEIPLDDVVEYVLNGGEIKL